MASWTELDVRKQSSPRYSLPLIPMQVPYKINKRETIAEEDDTKRERRNTRLIQLISSQRQQYDMTMQLTALRNEISMLTDKLIQTEEKVYRWKREFKDLQHKFIQVVNDHTQTREKLEDTCRMLEESEHIRSRWFLKKAQHDQEPISNTLPKKSSPRQHQSHSLPNNLLRFLKINPRKSTSNCII
ncbi:hypothetical protein BDF21DRAFT_458622 [Thamnidium elegans]|nr:hypothetical protein BDF21DRAFT_458622 [Thamnidium elegans]